MKLLGRRDLILNFALNRIHATEHTYRTCRACCRIKASANLHNAIAIRKQHIGDMSTYKSNDNCQTKQIYCDEWTVS